MGTMLAKLLVDGGKRSVYIVFALIIVSFVVLIFFSYRSIDRELTDAALSRRASISYLAAATLSEKFERLVDVGVSLATRVHFRELIGAGQWAEAGAILKTVPADFKFVDRLFVTDPDGTLMVDVPELAGARGGNFSHRDWFRGVSRDWKPYVSHVYKRAAMPQTNVFAVAVPIRGPQGAVLGVLVLQAQLDAFFEWTKNIGIGQGAFVYIVDSKGQIAFHPEYSPRGDIRDISKIPLVQQLLRGNAGVETMVDPFNGAKNIVTYSPTKYGWGVVAEQPVSTAFAAKSRQLDLLLTGYALILLLCIVVVYLASRLVIQHREAGEDRRIKSELENRVAERTDQLRTINVELENAMRSKDRFLASMSHELRTPLNAIIGFTGTLLMRLPGPLNADQEKQLKTVQTSARHQLGLINDLLDIAKIDSGKVELGLEAVACREVTDEVIESMRPLAAEKGLELKVSVADATTTVRTDRRALIQILLNFMSNAIKFTEHGTVSLTVNPRQEGGTHYIDFSVTDTGIGIRLEDQTRLFGAFEQVGGADARRHAGSGLGLHLSRKLAGLLGGRIEFASEYGNGSRFTLMVKEE